LSRASGATTGALEGNNAAKMRGKTPAAALVEVVEPTAQRNYCAALNKRLQHMPRTYIPSPGLTLFSEKFHGTYFQKFTAKLLLEE
jgi:hypothetical protein